MNTAALVMYALGLLYVIGFTSAVIVNDAFKRDIKFLDLLRIKKDDKNCIVEFFVYILIATPVFLLDSPAMIPGILIGVLGWITFAVLKVMDSK